MLLGYAEKSASLISSMLQCFTKISFDSIQVFPFILRMIYFISATKPSKTFFPANEARPINNKLTPVQNPPRMLHTRTWVRMVDASSSRASSIFVFFGPPHILCLRTLFPMYFNACERGNYPELISELQPIQIYIRGVMCIFLNQCNLTSHG